MNVDRRRASTSVNRSNVPAMAKPRAQSMQIASSTGHLEQPGVLKARANAHTNDAKASREYVSGAKLAAAGWETKATRDGRVFFFHRAQQRFVPCGCAPNMGFSSFSVHNCWCVGLAFCLHGADITVMGRSSWSADGLVKCWIEVVKNGETYYYHSHTHERRWNKPELVFA